VPAYEQIEKEEALKQRRFLAVKRQSSKLVEKEEETKKFQSPVKAPEALNRENL
jgi:hypothetical protein